jgi:hypothetical protein
MPRPYQESILTRAKAIRQDMRIRRNQLRTPLNPECLIMEALELLLTTKIIGGDVDDA